MNKLDYYLQEFKDQENRKIIKFEKSFTVVTADKDEDHIFSAEYVRKVIR